jgi:metallophosphoesterase superfamily enzyme
MTPHLPVSSPSHYHLLDPPHHRRALCPPRRIRCCAAAPTTRVFVVSDLHTDYQDNMEWVRRLPAEVGARRGEEDALVVAGDVAETRDNFARTMAVLRERFGAVFYVPGNHDLWLRREGGRYVSLLSVPPFRAL